MKRIFKDNVLLIFIISLALVKGLLWIGLVPALQTPDTERHFSTVIWHAEPEEKNWGITQSTVTTNVLDSSTYTIPPEFMQYLKISQFEQTRFNPNNHQLFVTNSIKGTGEENINSEGLSKHFIQLPPTIIDYPPLYYKTASWIYSAFKNTSILNRIYAIELYSLFLSILALIFTYKSARLLNFSKTSAALFMGIIAMQPMFSQASTSINPDIMLILGMTMFIFFSISILKTSFALKNSLGIAIASLIALYAKVPGLIVWPFLAILILLKLKKRALILCTAAVPIFLVVSYVIKPSFFAKNTNQFIPSLFSTGSLFPSYFDALATYLPKHFTLFKQYELFASYWGWFGWLDHAMSQYAYASIFILVIIGIISFFTYLFKKDHTQTKEKKLYIFLLFFVVIFHVGIMYSEFSLFKNDGTMFGLQGRYFLPTIVAYFLIIAKGFQFLFKKFQPETILTILFLLMVFLNMYSLISVILPAYYL